MGWVLFATGYDAEALQTAASEYAAADAQTGIFTLQHTVTADDAARGRPPTRA